MAVIYSTSFDDAGADIDLDAYSGGTPGSPWTETTTAGDFEIDDSDQRVEIIPVAADRTAIVTISGAPNDEYFVEAVVRCLGSNFVRIGVVVRGANGSTQGYWATIATNNNWELWRNTGSPTLIDSGTFTVARNTAYTLRLEVRDDGADTELRFFIDDSEQGGSPTFTDADANDIETGFPGIFGSNNTAREGMWESFNVDDLLESTIDVPTASLALTRLVPGVDAPELVDVPVRNLRFTRYVPSINTSELVDVPVASLRLTSFTPTVVVPTVIDVPVASLRFTSLVPSVNAPETVDVPLASLALTALTPVADAPQLIDVPIQDLDLTRYAPVIEFGIATVPAELQLTPYAPTVDAPEVVNVPVTALELARYVPIISGDGNITLEIPVATLELTSNAPTVIAPFIVGVPLTALRFNRYAPTVFQPATIDVPTGALRLQRYVPTVVATGDVVIDVPAASLVFTRYSPSVIGVIDISVVRNKFDVPSRRRIIDV